MFSTTLHVSFNIAALLNLIACLISKCSAPPSTLGWDHLLPPSSASHNEPVVPGRQLENAQPNVQRQHRPTSIPGGFTRPDSPRHAEQSLAVTTATFQPMARPPANSSKIPGQQLFAIYLISHASLYIGELLLTSLANDFPTMATHHLVATLLFLLLATHLPSIWPHFRPSYLFPFIVHAVYWSTLTSVSASVNDQLLALYNASLLIAACQASQAKGGAGSKAIRAGAVVAGVVVVVNYWTYCWEFSGGWCVHGAVGEVGGSGLGRLREMLWEGHEVERGTRASGLVVVGKYGVDAEVVREEARAWQVGVVNMWYGAGVVAMAFGLAARQE